jgi:hypothetical protein
LKLLPSRLVDRQEVLNQGRGRALVKSSGLGLDVRVGLRDPLVLT